jgi:outer membrane protein assembly factor BamD (BamD/ComL family)
LGAAAIAGTPVQPDRETPLDTAKRLAASDKREERVKALQILGALKKPGTALGDEYTYRYAELCLRFHGEGEPRTLEEARKAFTDLEQGSGSRWGLRGKIGLARVAAAEGKRDEAIKGLDRFLGQQTKCERAVEAAYWLGCLRAEKPDDVAELKQARVALDFALKMHEAVSRYNPPLVSTVEIRAKLDWINKKLKELADGRLKTLFDKAEKMRAAKKYDDAIKLYEDIRKEFPGEQLAELSGLRVCECIRGKGQLREAIAKAQAFVGEDPLGAYRGHAHLLIGDICLEQFFDIASSEPVFRCILEPEKSQPAWVKQERDRFLAVQQAARVTPSAPTDKTGDTWKEVLHHAHERVGILEYIRRNFDKAAEHFETSGKLRPVKGLEAEPVGMAEVAELCRKKIMPLDGVLLTQGDDSTKLVLFMAAVYIKGWKDDKSYDLFNRVYKNEFKGATADQRAYAGARMGACQLYKGEADKAIATYKEVVSDFGKSQYAADALLQHASALTRQGKVKEAVTVMDTCYTQYPGTRWADWALYQRAFIAMDHQDARIALDYMKQALTAYPRSQFAAHGTEYLKKIEERVRKRDFTPEGFPLD